MEKVNLLSKITVTKTELRKKMLEIAGKNMTAFISDLAFDFDEIDSMKVGDELFWAIRKTGTHNFKTFIKLCMDLHLVKVLHVCKIIYSNNQLIIRKETNYGKNNCKSS